MLMRPICIPRVSIHAPVKGATDGYTERDGLLYVSIHAPVKGATMASPAQTKATTFQSTRP